MVLRGLVYALVIQAVGVLVGWLPEVIRRLNASDWSDHLGALALYGLVMCVLVPTGLGLQQTRRAKWPRMCSSVAASGRCGSMATRLHGSRSSGSTKKPKAPKGTAVPLEPMPDKPEKIIKEGGYQPTKDPPDRPPSSALKPAADKPAAEQPPKRD